MGKPFNSITLRVAVSEWLSNPEEAEQKHGHIGSWNTSLVTDMSYMFGSAFSFNQSIGDWDVSNIEHCFYHLFNHSSHLKRKLE
jgi:hypothetical protein